MAPKPTRTPKASIVIGLAVLVLGFAEVSLFADQAPEAQNDSADYYGHRLVVDVLTNDVELDGEALTLSLDSTNCPASLAISFDGPLVVVDTNPATPPVSCTITYRVTDERDDFDTAVLSLIAQPGVFSDGFETANTSRWDATVF